MKKVFKTLTIGIMMVMLSATAGFAQTSNTYNDGNNNDFVNNPMATHWVSLYAYAPPPSCYGHWNVTKIIAKVRWLWANGEELKPMNVGEMTWLGGNLYYITFPCAGCHPDYIEYCLEGKDDWHFGNGGQIIALATKKEGSAYPNDDTFIVNKWNGLCFGYTYDFPDCPY